jgi:hypothetical protein
MDMKPREWVSLKEAAERIGVSITTVREWCRSGAVDSRGQSPGIVVDLNQVREKAMGFAARRRPSDLQDRVADSATVRNETDDPTPTTLTINLPELQELVRERVSPRSRIESDQSL